MSDSDTETLYEQPISTPKVTLGRRGLEWRDKLLKAVASKIKIAKLKALGWTKDEIADQEPGYYYDEEYHGLTSSSWYRQNKSFGDLSNAIGTSKGYSAWEWCGERLDSFNIDCVIE